MITNENFTAETLRELRSNSIRLVKIEQLNSQLNSATKNMINNICSKLFAMTGVLDKPIIECRHREFAPDIIWSDVESWFMIQGFEVGKSYELNNARTYIRF